MSVWSWKIDVGISKFFLKHAIRWHAHYDTAIALLLLHDAEQHSIHNPPHSLGSQRPTATRGTGFLLEQLVAESINQYASTTARGQLACTCNPTTTTKTQSLRLIDLHARRWSWGRVTETERVGNGRGRGCGQQNVLGRRCRGASDQGRSPPR